MRRGTLDSGDRAAFERHLESCASCRQMAAAQQAVWSALDELSPLPVSSNFDAKLYQRIAEEQQSAIWQRGRWQRWFQAGWSWQPAMPVAAACVALIVAFLLKNSGPAIAHKTRPNPSFKSSKWKERWTTWIC